MVGALAGGLLLSACGSPAPAPTGIPRYQFTCCADADVSQIWHPGETVVLHWQAQRVGSDGTDTRHEVVLTAVLSGPYPDVPTLKKGAGGQYAVQGSVVRTDDASATPPVTTFFLPTDLPPGYYDLALKVDMRGGSSMSVESVVRVGAR